MSYIKFSTGKDTYRIDKRAVICFSSEDAVDHNGNSLITQLVIRLIHGLPIYITDDEDRFLYREFERVMLEA